MPFHTEDEFRGANRKGNRSKDTLRKQFWRENPVIGPSVLLKGQRTSAEYTIRRKNMKITDCSYGRNKFVRGLYHWDVNVMDKNTNRRFMMKFYSSRDHHSVYTGNSRKKWLLKGWFIDGKDCNFHKTRRNNRVNRTYTAKRNANVNNDFMVSDKKPITFPVNVQADTLKQNIPKTDDVLYWYIDGGWKRDDTNIIFFLGYKECSLCNLITTNTRYCEECGGKYPLCSSHKKFRSLCHVCGMKCRLCKKISSMRFDNPSHLKSFSFSRFISNKRKMVGIYDTFDICQLCEDEIVERIQDIDIIKDVGTMIVEYVKE
ncbi:MAG: hypothetical protein PHG66_04775 [Candidatus Colwellbacteria bacterium]|nr:hypothetical protein [Candidatus Colwellbacteria bacterium]